MSSAMNHAKRSHRSHKRQTSVCSGIRQTAKYAETVKGLGALSLFRAKMMSRRRKVLEHRGAKEAMAAQ